LRHEPSTIAIYHYNLTTMQIYISKAGQQQGPYSHEQLDNLLQSEAITGDDLYWYEGCENWQPLSQFPGFSPSSSSTPPASPQEKALQATTTPTTDPVALWNPTACVNWSLFFTPIFGSLLIWRNYQILKDDPKAQKALFWAAACIALAVISMFLPENKAAAGLYALMIPWYILVARPQMKYVKERFGSTYPKKSWKQPLGIAIAGLVFYGVLAAVFAPAQVEDTEGNRTPSEGVQSVK
jgi:GYF domain 2